jgi:DNA-binding transcriptional regulator LsrR (DeoR family)
MSRRKMTEARVRRAIEVGRVWCARPELQLQQIDRLLDFSRRTSARALKDARRLGLLTIKEDLPSQVERNPQIGSRLGKLFSPTQMVVIERPKPISARARRKLEREQGADDLLHELLGMAAAEEIAETLRNNDIVAVGAGRGVFHTARALASLPGRHKKRTGIQVIALHGRATRRVWRKASRYPLHPVDCLRVVHALADALPMSSVHPIDLPLVQSEPSAVREALAGEASFLTYDAWARRPPDLALIGLGIMGAPQALDPASDRRTLPWSRAERASPIFPHLRQLRRICARFREIHGYIPISDVCDRLFWVPEDGESPDLRNEAASLIETVNSHLLTVETGLGPSPPPRRPTRPASLDQVREVVLVAGGQYKTRAIYRLLCHKSPNKRSFADTLVTDVGTAEALIRLAEESKAREPSPTRA